jgi:hypothetical protein
LVHIATAPKPALYCAQLRLNQSDGANGAHSIAWECIGTILLVPRAVLIYAGPLIIIDIGIVRVY